MANQKRSPFIPKLSSEFKPMRHYYCETETTAKLISRSVFLRLLAEQPYPMGQVSIDFDGGFAYAGGSTRRARPARWVSPSAAPISVTFSRMKNTQGTRCCKKPSFVTI